MNDATIPGPPTAGQAKAMLEQADGLGASIRSGASWPAVTFLLGLGAVSSMGIIVLAYADQIPGASAILPISVMGAWLLILIATDILFSRTAKRGFGIRWVIYIGLWGALWAAGTLLSGPVFADQLWFTGLIAALLTISTTACAWYEARR